ncbi:MAG TPA: TonB-dependent receptor, partial [Candidatus Polarisedimenticolia bacterium]|nr:TonB-dependent receptor [Candidatus Polarisedimenticolia bacterium]
MKVALLLLIAIAPAAGESAAQDADAREKTALGEPITPLLAMPMGEAPGATWVITAEEISRSGAANIFDLLRRVPGLDIRYTPMGGHIGIRSTGPSPFSEQVLLLIDGTPYNSPDKGGFPGHPNYRGFFPLERIERIEIIRGPVSVLYGANAFGGVINIVSKRAADALDERVEGAAYGATILGGERDTLDRSLRAAFIKHGWDASLEASGQDGDTPVSLNGDARHRRADLYAKLRRGGFSASVLHQESSHGSFSFLGTPTRTARNEVDIVDTHYAWRASAFSLRGSASVNRYRGTTCGVCHNNQTLEPDNARTAEVGDEREMDQRLRVALRADRTITDRQDITFGFEAMHDTVRRDIVRAPGAPRDLTGGGVYLQHQWHLMDRRLHILSGVRHDQSERLTGATSPRLALVAEVTDDLILRGSAARAYRAPTWNERYLHQRLLPEEVAPGVIVVAYGDEGLRRERIDSAEAGISWRFVPEAVLRVDLYHNTIRRFIQRGSGPFVPGTPSERQVLYANRDDDFAILGGEVSVLTHPLEGLSLTAGYAFRQLTIDWDDPHAAYAPRSRATLTAAWSPRPDWAFDVTGSYASRYTVSNPATFGVRPQDPYQLWDAAVHYTLPVEHGRWRLGLIGRNLFDENQAESLNN